MPWYVSSNDKNHRTFTHSDVFFSPPPIIKEIILIPSFNGKVWLHMHMAENPFTKDPNNFSQALLNAWAAAGFRYESTYEDKNKKCENKNKKWFRVSLKTGSREVIEFLNIAQKHEDINDEICANILHNAGCGEEVSIRKIKKLVEDNEIDQAIALAQEEQTQKRYEVIWSLASLFAEKFEQNLLDAAEIGHLITVYSHISTNNPYYKNAQIKLYHLALNANFDDEIARQKYLFLTALKSEEQKQINYAFASLANIGLTIPEEFKNIGCNSETLINVASYIAQQNEEIKKLTQDLEIQKRLVEKTNKVDEAVPQESRRALTSYKGGAFVLETKVTAKVDLEPKQAAGWVRGYN
ncbi:MAG: hypothetical protein V4496_04240 [Pseudomonadota bacterium]